MQSIHFDELGLLFDYVAFHVLAQDAMDCQCLLLFQFSDYSYCVVLILCSADVVGHPGIAIDIHGPNSRILNT